MIKWDELPNIKGDFLLQRGGAGACTEAGFRIKMCRAAEYIIKRSNLRGASDLECVRLYAAVDWSSPDYEPGLTPMNRRPTDVMFRACYMGPLKHPPYPDDLYRVDLSLMAATETQLYTDDRTEYGQRLIRLVAECWKESWELFHHATWGERHRLKWWPVRLWTHGEPELAYELMEDGSLMTIPGGLTAEEASLVDIPPQEQA